MDDVDGINFDDETWKDIQPIYNSPEEDAVVQIAYSERCLFNSRIKIKWRNPSLADFEIFDHHILAMKCLWLSIRHLPHPYPHTTSKQLY